MSAEQPAKGLNAQLIKVWTTWGTRFLPFADVATPELPLSRLLRLSLIQVSVGISLVLLVGTLNRVMIVELGVPASVVGVMLALPLLAAPFRALVGHKSDTHKSAMGWRRVPYIYMGTMVQFGGLAFMPFAILVLSGAQEAFDERVWLGMPAAAIAFLMVGAGIHLTQTVGLALATDLTKTEQQPNVVGLMYVMLLLGSIGAALFFGWVLADFSQGRLIQVIQGCAVVTVSLNFLALWKQETRIPSRLRPQPVAPDPSFRESWDLFVAKEKTLLRLLAVGLGTLAFSMSDIVLEPYGGEVLNLGVGTTTLPEGSKPGCFGQDRQVDRESDPCDPNEEEQRQTDAGVDVKPNATFVHVPDSLKLLHPRRKCIRQDMGQDCAGTVNTGAPLQTFVDFHRFLLGQSGRIDLRIICHDIPLPIW